MSDNQRILRQIIYEKDIEVTTALVSRSNSELIVQKTFKYGESKRIKDELIQSYKEIHALIQPKAFSNLDSDLKKAKYNFVRYDIIPTETMLCIQSKALVPDGKESHWDTLESFAESFTKTNREPLDENIILLYLTQMLRALAYLHSIGVCMSEKLHETNIFVKTSNDYLQLLKRKSCLCISDFTSGGGDASYDMWRLGVILAKIILAGAIGEYINTNNFISVEHDSEALIRRVQVIGHVYSLQLINLTVALLNPKQRPTARFVLNSAFVNSFLQQSIDLIRPINLIEIGASNVTHVTGSIDKAIQKADLQSILVVKEGTYHETVIIDRNVTVMALKSHRVTIDGDVVCRGGIMLNGFTITGNITVEVGSIIITDNLVNSIQVLDESTPTIKSNHITGGSNGIILVNRSKAKICNNDIFECAIGVMIGADSKAMIEKNNIYECTECGILVTENSKGIIRENKISNNTIGISVQKESNPVIDSNVISDNTRAGILFSDSLGCARDNQLVRNDNGIEIHDSQVLIEGNKCYNNLRNGILAIKGKQKIVSNDCSWNNANGIEITQKCDPLVVSNTITNNFANGISIIDASGVYKGNTVTKNPCNLIMAHSKCLVKKNRFTHSTTLSSVIIEKTSRCRIMKNIIENNTTSGLEIRDSKTKVALTNTIIRNNGIHGIHLHDSAVCEVESNTIHSNAVEPQISVRGHSRIRDKTETNYQHSTSFSNSLDFA